MSRILERVDHVDVRSDSNRQYAKDHDYEQRKGRSERNDPAVDSEWLEAADVLEADDRVERRDHPLRENNRQHAAGCGENDRFTAEVADNLPASGAKREPHRELLSTAGRHREQQIGDVCAGDHQNERNRPFERDEHGTRSRRQSRRERPDGDRPAAFGGR